MSTHTPVPALQDVGHSLSTVERELERALGENDLARRELDRRKTALLAAEHRLTNIEMAAAIIQDAAFQWKRETAGRVDRAVSSALSAVFETEYRFTTKWVTRRGKIEADFEVRGGGVAGAATADLDILTNRGGGIRDIAAFALRVAVWWMTSPRPAPVLVLDEPFRFVSSSFHATEQVRGLLEELSREFGVQIVLITHETELQVGKVYTIRAGGVDTGGETECPDE